MVPVCYGVKLYNYRYYRSCTREREKEKEKERGTHTNPEALRSVSLNFVLYVICGINDS